MFAHRNIAELVDGRVSVLDNLFQETWNRSSDFRVPVIVEE
jgi:hypothetical protein